MKKLLIILYLILQAQYLFAQNTKPVVEVRLNLLERGNDFGPAHLALGISFINHSDKNIYLPNFELFGSYSGIHVYQKKDEVWREIDVDTHDYYRPYVPPVTIRRGDTIIHYDNDLYIPNFDNSLANSYNKHCAQLNRQQDSMIKKFYNSSADHHGLMIFVIYGEKPLFLKAKQTLENFLVRDFDYLLSQQMDYKISFNSELRDTIKYYSKPKVYSKKLKKFEDLHLPGQIYNYQLYFPEKILSNTIYYSTKYLRKN